MKDNSWYVKSNFKDHNGSLEMIVDRNDDVKAT